jgi:hypothetical protein
MRFLAAREEKKRHNLFSPTGTGCVFSLNEKQLQAIALLNEEESP